MNTSIVWFKNDLRLQDNETLVAAINESEQIIPVYCIDDNYFETTKYGFKKTGSFRAQFLFESLIDLDNNLRALGSGLLIVQGKPEEELIKIARQYNVKNVHAKFEIAPDEKKTENAVATALESLNISLHTFETSTLYKEFDLPFELNKLPDIFTGFRNKVEKNALVRKSFSLPTKVNSPIIPILNLPSLQSLGLEEVKMDHRSAIAFRGGETEAQKRLQHYFYETKAISKYKETRNELIGANYSSKFSAWLAMGCISPIIIYDELKKYEALHGANESTYWLVFELLWRDYFYFVLQKFGKKLFKKEGIKNDLSLQTKLYPTFFAKWVNGETGIDFIDANMKELKLTGFMSNRGRQNVASYLCNDLKIDWRYGAAYFEEQLIDYDVASNWGNWAYLAGVGNDPRPHRYFNIEKQAKDYDKDKLYRNLWIREN
jgi:deoxyribodipyrimidine photo-lyase